MDRARDKLKAWREAKGLNQTEAAEMVGVWQGSWSAWESGRKRPSIEQLVRLEELTKGSRHRVRVEDWVETEEEREERRRSKAASA
jgi:transcriptional regulator with XRE-family HTH domain